MGQSRVETVEFDGAVYRRYPDSPRRTLRVYFFRGATKKRKRDSLHRALWEFHHGPIPDAHEVHHADGNPLNNDIGNLMCVTLAEHRRLDAARGAYRTPAVIANLERIRPLTKEWHGSEAGRKWHAENARAGWADPNRKRTTAVCDWCKKSFVAAQGHARLCSNKCAAAERRASGVDDEDRSCVSCGGTFRVNRYSKVKTCSRPCGDCLRSRSRRGLNHTVRSVS
jgi:hypothetical protein